MAWSVYHLLLVLEPSGAVALAAAQRECQEPDAVLLPALSQLRTFLTQADH